MDTTNTRRIIRLSAVYDLLVTAGFALPWTVGAAFAAVRGTHHGLGLSGALPGEDPFTLLFANLMGSLVVVWAAVRIVRPELLLGAADVAARLLFALGMVAALSAGGSTVLIGFLVTEIAWAAVQGGAVVAAYRRRPVPTPTLAG